MHADHVQAVEQILTEFTFLYPHFQVLVGGGDDAYVNLHRGITTDPIELAICQHPQQAGLHIQRHIADFIQEQGPAVGLLKATLTDLVGAGKGPFFMPEKFGLDQVFGDRRHIQRDKRRFGARTVTVQGMGHQLFTGT